MDADDTPTPESDDHITLATRAEAFAELAELDASVPPDGSSQDEDSLGRPDMIDSDVAPPVVLVMVVHNADSWLDEVLTSIGSQTYTNLSVLVIDAASDIDPTPRVARVLPGAFVRRLESNIGFGPTVNEILELVSGASFYCVCHDDVVLDPECVHELVAEAFRSNAGIVGPKALSWDDDERLVSVGFTVDRSGGRAPYAEIGELDQGQHDAVRDVFAVSGGCTLIRADLFEHLGGFDPGVDLVGEDLDLCWRAHLVGARVVVAPQARIRHRQALPTRIDADRFLRMDAAHRVRTVLANYRFGHLIALIPQLLAVTLVEAIVQSVIGRGGHSRAQLRAWGTNFRAVRSVHGARRRVRAIRETNDRAIARLQTRTWARLEGLVQAHRRSRATGSDQTAIAEHFEADRISDGIVDDEERDSFVRTGNARRSYSMVTWGVIVLVVLLAVGTRELFFGPLPSIGTFADAPSNLSDLWRTWLHRWNPVGLGSAQPPSAGVGTLSVGGTIVLGALGFLRRFAILMMIPIGMFGVWRLARPLGTRRAQLVALVLYAVVPVPWNALSQGIWAGLVLYAVSPWLVLVAARLVDGSPFRAGMGTDADTAKWWSPILGFALLLAVVGSVVPAVVVVAALIVVGLLVGSVVTGRLGGTPRLVATTSGAILVAAVLSIPWVLVGPGRSAWSIAGVGSSVHGWLDLSSILRFQTGPFGAGAVGYGFLLAALLPLVIGRSWRFVWGVRAWSVAGACFTAAWLGQQDWFDLPIPAVEALLAPAAVALALSAACGAAAVETDLPSFRFGWAQAATIIATGAVVAVTLPQLANAADGRWKMAPVGLDQAFDFISTQREQHPFRVLWVGDPAVMPVAGWRLDERSMIGTANEGAPAMTELWAPADPGGSGALIDAVRLAKRSETTRLGRVLADMDVRYVVLPRQIVPLPYRSAAHVIPDELLGAFDEQLDLTRVSSNDAAVVYRNEAWTPDLRLYPPGMSAGSTVSDALSAPIGRQVRGSVDPVQTSKVTIPATGILATGQPAGDGWTLRVGGKTMQPVTLWGWEQGFVVDRAGVATITRSGGATRPLTLAAMAALWFAVVLAWWFGRRRGREDDLVGDDRHEGRGAAGSLVRLGAAAASEAGAVAVDEVRVGDDDGSSDDGDVRLSRDVSGAEGDSGGIE